MLGGMDVSSNPKADWIAPYLPRLKRSGRILELGCGTGRDTRDLIHLGDVVAIDHSESRLRKCRENAPSAKLVCADLSHQLPLRTDAFPAVIASLCLHYFPWRTTLALVAEIRRVMTLGGLLVVRVNSTNDANFGAVGHSEIESNLYDVNGYSKRFFDRRSIVELFQDWSIEAMQERVIMRYEEPKWIWEFHLHPT